MDRSTIFTKTDKGLLEASGGTSALPPDLRRVLESIDGKTALGELANQLDGMPETSLMDALVKMQLDGYVSELATPPVAAPSATGAENPDLTPARAAKTEQDKAEAIERAKAEAVVKARLEVERRAKARAEAQARQAAAEQARQDAEALARREAEAQAIEARQEQQRADEKYRQRIEEKERQRTAETDRQRAETEERQRDEEEERQRVEEKERQRVAEEDRQRAEEEERQRAAEEEERKRAEEEERQRAEAEERQRAAEEEEQKRAEEEERKRIEEEELKRAIEEKERQRVEAEERRRAEAEQERQRIAEEQRQRDEEEQERQRAEEEERHRLEQQTLKADAESREAPPEKAPAQPAEAQANETAEPQSNALGGAVGGTEAQALAEAIDGALASDGTTQEPVAAGPGRVARLLAASLLAAKRLAGRLLAARVLVGTLLADRLRRPGTWITLIALAVFAALAAAATQIHRITLDVAQFEMAAAERLGKPVSIGAIHIALLPRPHLSLENIAIGKERQIRIASMKATPEIGAILNRRMAFKHIGIDSLQLPQADVARALWGKDDGHALRVDRMTVTNLTLELQGKAVPGFDLEAVFGPAGLQSAQLNRVENDLSVTLEVEGDKTQIEVSARRFVMPFAERMELEALSAKGTVSALGLDFSDFSARTHDGVLRGSARLAWRDGWSFEGKISAAGMDMTKLGASVFSGGRLDGQGNYAMRAAAPDKLLDTLHIDGSFTIQNGTIANVDLARLVQREPEEGGSTQFSELRGSVLVEQGRIELRQLRLAAGTLSSGGGVADVDAQGNLSGRMLLQVRTESTLGLALLGIAGTLKQPQFIRTL